MKKGLVITRDIVLIGILVGTIAAAAILISMYYEQMLTYLKEFIFGGR